MSDASDSKHFLLYSNCIAVKGAYKSAIYDLQSGVLQFIPNLLQEVLLLTYQNSVDKIKEIYKHELDEGLDKFFNLLVQKGRGFYTSTPDQFPSINEDFHFPSQISNVILEIGLGSNTNYFSIVQQLDNLGCAALEIRLLHDASFGFLKALLFNSLKSRLVEINLILMNNVGTNQEFLLSIVKEHKRVRSICVFESEEDSNYQIGNVKVQLISQKFSKEICGNIRSANFPVNLKMYTEAKHFNSCLNRKLTIDQNGNIKNCPSMNNAFGKIDEVNLKDVVSTSEFQKHWGINKDQIKVCKDCEFRYACTDCRAYLEDPADIHSKPLKCGYDPYTGVWEEWSTNPLKQEAINFYGMEELVKSRQQRLKLKEAE